MQIYTDNCTKVNHSSLYSYLYIDCNLVTRQSDDGHGHKSDGNMLVKDNDVQLNIFMNAFIGLSYGYKRANILVSTVLKRVCHF